MNEVLTREEIEKRIARLRGEVVPAEEPAPNPDADPEADYLLWLAQQKQPENEPPREFIVGEQRNRIGEREALPPYRWPDPGGQMTREAYDAYDREQYLRMGASQELANCIRHQAVKLQGIDAWTDRYQGPQCELFEKRWAYLVGLWRARGIKPPDEEALQKWAKEGLRRDGKRGHAQEQTS